MRITISLFVLSCLFTGKGLLAQETDITGAWIMYELTWINGDQVNKTTENQLEIQAMITEYDFKSDGKLILVSNMTGSGRLETMEGSWKLDGDKLTCSYVYEENPVDVVWDFEFKDEAIHLMRSSPDGSSTVINSFKRK